MLNHKIGSLKNTGLQALIGVAGDEACMHEDGGFANPRVEGALAAEPSLSPRSFFRIISFLHGRDPRLPDLVQKNLRQRQSCVDPCKVNRSSYCGSCEGWMM